MTIYLAGSWSQKSAVRYARDKFQAVGIKVQSDWIDAPDEVGHEQLRASAYRDLAQLDGLRLVPLEPAGTVVEATFDPIIALALADL